jgi:hypothetical protein
MARNWGPCCSPGRRAHRFASDGVWRHSLLRLLPGRSSLRKSERVTTETAWKWLLKFQKSLEKFSQGNTKEEVEGNEI